MSTHDIELPQGYAERPFDYSGDLYIEGQVRAIVEANRALVSATLQAEIEALRAEVDALRKALEDVRSQSTIDLAMQPNLFALTARLGDIHQIAGAALAKENSND